MTEPRTPPPDDREPVDPDVALASAHVDGELDEADQARIAADPGAAALAVRLAAIAHEVREVPPPPAELVDDHVSAALAAMDDDELAAHDAPAAVPLDAARRARPAQPWWQRVPLGAVAAVIAVVALVGAIGLASQAGDDDQDTAATALDAADEGSDGGDESADAETGDDTGALEAAPFGSAGGASAPRLAYAGYDELVAALGTAPATSAAGGVEDRGDQPTGEEAAESDDEVTADQGAPPIDPCGAVVVLGLEGMEIEQVLPATVAGDPVTAVVYVADGERRVSVVDDVRCTPTFEGELAG
ncbi:MAG TPA: hypothetical protein VFU14_17885 [Acidimicrobiales bacterium]|nr:hypothetical protein [Acidimicrobiales bacterium]